MQFIDLKAQQRRIRQKLEQRILGVLDHGAYILGDEVQELETKLAEFSGAKYCVTCANGTDALSLALTALGIGEGDAVFVPSFTFAATAEVVPETLATPIFVDVDPRSYNLRLDSLVRCIEYAGSIGLRPRAVIPVDLFGLPADYPQIEEIAKLYDLHVVADSAQGFGASISAKRSGCFGDVTTTSFFPAKPLGCYGDGGALFTDDEELKDKLESLRFHGKGAEKYDNVRIGRNSRLDTIQAAVLLEKLEIYDSEIAAREAIAAQYTALLSDHFQTPSIPRNYRSVFAQYTLQTESSDKRTHCMKALSDAKIPSVVYYPKPLHQQTAYREFPRDPEGLQNSEAVSGRVFSIPMHPYLTQDDIERIAKVLTVSADKFNNHV